MYVPLSQVHISHDQDMTEPLAISGLATLQLKILGWASPCSSASRPRPISVSASARFLHCMISIYTQHTNLLSRLGTPGCRNVAGQIAAVQAELEAAQAAAEAAAREVEAARAEDSEAKQVREHALRGKQKAERNKITQESQLDELTSQQPEDADTTSSALQEALKAIFDKDAEIRVLQQRVSTFPNAPLPSLLPHLPSLLRART